MNSKVSIITVVYNAKDMIISTIESVVNQTYNNIEFIIIDGASTDGTIDLIKQYSDKISFFISENDAGIYDAMNKGIKNATGEWITFLNAGDVYINDQVISNIFDNQIYNDEDLIYGAIALDCPSGMIVYPKEFTLLNLLFWGTGTLCHQSMFVRQKSIVNYSEDYKLKGELNWYFDILPRIRKYYIIETATVVYNTQGTGTQHFYLNHIENLKVVFRQKYILGIVSLPFLTYSLIKSIINSRS
ncbi:MAG: glycosyltransferase family 2 protein [Sulfurimonas sp.]|uniref:glycosyltransferase family 2 protein n=1 Tax=Sulfurimonas sp. TaxID=2022749 RepID=UPI003D0B8132